jgi:hypothetical protein
MSIRGGVRIRITFREKESLAICFVLELSIDLRCCGGRNGKRVFGQRSEIADKSADRC